jgi:ATP-binding cassette subfamily B protein
LSLILRLYTQQAGTIAIDGIDIREISRRSLREQIAYVGQDVFLFSGTVRENIRLGKLSATEEEIIKAAKAAHVHDFISCLPNGYDTPVGESGSLFSGGQRQRIAVARALIRNSKIILLDEATSSLDSESEREVQSAIAELRKGRTCLAVAHRLHTIFSADCIHVVESGAVVESGRHAELIHKKGRYADFYYGHLGQEIVEPHEPHEQRVIG